jgi:uncharacterized protein YegJ (DUF2314 family)
MNLRIAVCLAFTFLAITILHSPVRAGQAPPQDRPAGMSAEQAKRFEDAIAPYVKQARTSLPSAKAKFLSGLKPGEIFYITIRLYDDQRRFEQVFVKVNEWKGTAIHGVIASDLALIKDKRKGEKITCKEEDVFDWTISKPDGTEEGNFVGKFLDTYQP